MKPPIRSRAELVTWIESCVLGDLRTLLAGVDAYYASPATERESRTFGSQLAMRGAPERAIQELAGHQDLGTTQRYMYLSPAALNAAIR